MGWTQQFWLKEASAEAEGEAREGPKVIAPVRETGQEDLGALASPMGPTTQEADTMGSPGD